MIWNYAVAQLLQPTTTFITLANTDVISSFSLLFILLVDYPTNVLQLYWSQQWMRTDQEVPIIIIHTCAMPFIFLTNILRVLTVRDQNDGISARRSRSTRKLHTQIWEKYCPTLSQQQEDAIVWYDSIQLGQFLFFWDYAEPWDDDVNNFKVNAAIRLPIPSLYAAKARSFNSPTIPQSGIV